jgi:CDP-6-deoxy-D-xylo-4-hexulose-3-dehydrase
MKIKDELGEDVRKLVHKHYKELHNVKKFRVGETYIPVAKAVFDELEVEALVNSSLRMKFVDGEISNTFEKELARFLGVKYATFCNSGSSANLLAFSALTSPLLGSRAIQAGDEVITCAVGFPTTVAPILQHGCIPVWVDVSIGTYNPSPHMIEDAITEKTKAIFIAHTLGNPFDAEAIKEIADRNNLWLIEDVCDGIGAEYDRQKIGTFGHISTTSFYPAHLMTTGEGGMVFTDNPMLNLIIRSFRDWGRSCFCPPGKDNTCGHRFSQNEKARGELPEGFDHKYIYSHVGYNLKSTDLQASIGLEQLKKLPEFIRLRRENWLELKLKLFNEGLHKYFILPEVYNKSRPAPFGLIITLKEDVKFTRKELVEYLEEHKIGTRHLFGGNLSKQPAFVGKGIIPELGGLPKADIVMKNSFWIGVHPAITSEMIDYIVSTFVEFMAIHV